jgi:uncharacterized Tic20 family protein
MMTELEHPSLSTQDERIMAGLSHLSIIVPMAGLIAPIVVWVTSKDKSEYVAFQALQAMAYQISLILLYMIGWACYGFSFFGMFLTIPFAPPEGSTEAPSPLFFVSMFFPFIIMGLIFLLFITLGIYGIIGGIMSFQGKPFRYIVIGKMVEKFRDNTKDDA